MARTFLANAAGRGGMLALAAVWGLIAGGPAVAGGGDTEHKVAWQSVHTPSPGKPQAIGGYAHGCLAGGQSLPLEGVGYQVMRPSRHRYFGHSTLVDYLQGLGRRAQAAGLGVVNIGDMAQPRGGPMPTGHASHQIGLDVDVWLRLDLPALPRDRRDHLTELTVIDRDTLQLLPGRWSQTQAELLHQAARDPRVDRIFVNPVIKSALCRQTALGDRAWLGRIRPWYSHHDHFHVRLSCPADSPLCEPQKPLPPGDGCDEDLVSWARDARPPDPDKPPPPAPVRNPILPLACYQINLAGAP
jgi:penicillin-insensitive murein endopeptidase